MNNIRIEWIDIAKGMAIFLMVCGHTSIPENLSNWIWSFHMPLFFIVSGMLFYPERYNSFVAFEQKRCRTLLLPWLVFTLVAVFFYPEDSINTLLSGQNLFALWFLPVLFMVETLGYYIVKLKLWGGKLLVAISLATVGFILDQYGIRTYFNLEVSLYATLFYIVGFLSRKTILKINSQWHWIILLLLINIILSIFLPRTDMASNKCGWYGVNAINAMIGSLAVFLMAKKIETWNSKNILKRFLLWAGVNTIVILGLSQVVNLTMKKIMENLPIHSTLNSISRHILLLLILWGVAYLINKYVPELIGKKRKY